MKIDLVIKVGGSLGHWHGVGSLLDSIARWRDRTTVLVVPGGGPFADLVRLAHRQWQLTESAAHRLAILAMDQYGLLLCGVASRALPVDSLSSAGAVLRSGRLPIFLPSRTLFRRDPFSHSWNVTSDSIAAYIAGLARADALVLLKDVDGIFAQDPKINLAAPFLPHVARSRLGRYRCVDREFAKWVRGIGSCWIVNGTRPDRVKEWLERGETAGTCIRMR